MILKALLKKCEKLLDSDEKEITIHGLGRAISRACNLAQNLREIHHDTLELDIKSSTVLLTGTCKLFIINFMIKCFILRKY